jgi:hypothetical protein
MCFAIIHTATQRRRNARLSVAHEEEHGRGFGGPPPVASSTIAAHRLPDIALGRSRQAHGAPQRLQVRSPD